MNLVSINDAAILLNVSQDTVRRWIDQSKLTVTRDPSGKQAIPGEDLAKFVMEYEKNANPDELLSGKIKSSVRNHITGIVTAIKSDKVMSQVELYCGPYRVVSLISTEAVKEMGLTVGMIAAASVKATNVSIQVPK